MRLCACGCGEVPPLAKRTRADLGHVKGEPVQYCQGHNARRTPNAYVEEDRGYETPCWIWQRNINRAGYGMVTVDGRVRVAHGVYYERAHGPVPDGLELDHLCRVRECVRPDHLEAVTHHENVKRGWAARTLDASNLARLRYEAGLSQREVARAIGCAQTALSAWERGTNPLSDDLRERLVALYEETTAGRR